MRVIVTLICSIFVLLATANPAHDIKKRANEENINAAMQKVIEKGMVFATGVIEKLKDSDVARKLIGKMFGATGGGRAKRSIRLDTAVTKLNVAQYQKLELHKTINKDGNGNGVTGTDSCPIDQNELNLIETVSILIQQALVQVNQIINGRKVNYFIPKPKPENI
ncbi:uncharacterized protein LOC131292852 [Anopheles ziemanni]|uniref:uncharacterized protein LOC131271202 n=1 Tax=Anopheles coustani TaxID=139045 RepID=UPI0026584D07|nr:uncharacterized protein LOC131271202 [Anopheles coustani]XP_058176929.1 uncharacterized protein LOC131292852 [Anopheles ziemanni]